MKLIGNMLIYFVTGFIYWWWTANLSVFGVAPNIVFVAALCAAIISPPARAITFCFFFGIYLDLLGSNLFGAYALTYTLMAYGIHMMKRHIDLVGSFSQIIAALSLTFVTMLFYQGVSLSLAKINPLQLKSFLVEPFLNAVLAPIVFYLFAQLRRRFDLL
jgi:rod shape-determining protein MreD